jgi:hypothetical protein
MPVSASSSSSRRPLKRSGGGGGGGGGSAPTPPTPQAPPPDADDASQQQKKPRSKRTMSRLEEVRRRNASLRAAIGMVIATDSTTATAASPAPAPAVAVAPAAVAPQQPKPSSTTLDIVCVTTADPAVPTGAEDLAAALTSRGHRVAVVAPPRSDEDTSSGWKEALTQARQKVSQSDNGGQNPAHLALDWRAAALLGGRQDDAASCVVALLEGSASSPPTPALVSAARAVLAPSPSHAAELASALAAADASSPAIPIRGVIGGLGLPRALAEAWDPLSDPFLAGDGGTFDPRTPQGLGWEGRARHQEALRREVGLRLPPGLLEAAVAAAEEAEDGGDAQNEGDEDDPFALPAELLKQFEEAEAAIHSLDDDADAGDEVRAGARSLQAPMLLAVPCRLSAKDGHGGSAAEVLVEALPRLVARGVQVVVVALLAGGGENEGEHDDDEPALASSAWASALAAAARGLPPRPQAPIPPQRSAARRLLELARRDCPDSVRVLFAAEGGRTAARLMHLALAGADAVVVLPPADGGGEAAPAPPPLRPEYALPVRGAPGSLAHLAMRYGALPLAYAGAGGGALDDCRAGGLSDYGALVAEEGECGSGFLWFGDEDGEGGSSGFVSPLSSYAGMSSTDEEEEDQDQEEGVERRTRAPRAVKAAARALARRAAEAMRVLRRRPRRWRAMQMRAASVAVDDEVDRRAWARGAAACEGLLLRRRRG